METNGIKFGKIFFLKSILRTLEDFLNFDDEISEDFLNIKDEVSQEILEVKNDKKSEINLRRSKRNIKKPLRYGYDKEPTYIQKKIAQYKDKKMKLQQINNNI